MKGYFWLLNWRDLVVPHGGECISVWVRVVVHTIYIHSGELREVNGGTQLSYSFYLTSQKRKNLDTGCQSIRWPFFFHLNPIPCPYSGTFPEVQMIANLGRLTKINHHNTKIKYNTSSSKDLHNYFIKTLLMIP